MTKVLIAQNPYKDGIGRYVDNISRFLKVDILYTKNILSLKNFFQIYFGYKIVHFPHFVAPLLKLPGQKFITTIQDITPILTKDFNLLKRIYIWIRIYFSLIQSDHIIFTSQYVRDCCLKKFKVKFNYSIIPLGVDFDQFNRDLGPVYKDSQYFLIIGRRNAHKNVPNMIKAFSKANISKDVKLIITGRLSPKDNYLIELIRELQIEERIQFWGETSDLQLVSLLKYTTGLLFVSKFEGFGLPVLEGMAAGCTVITSNTASIPEVAGNCAYLVDPDDILGIILAIESATQSIQVEQLKKCGRDRAKLFSWRKTSKATEILYESLLEK